VQLQDLKLSSLAVHTFRPAIGNMRIGSLSSPSARSGFVIAFLDRKRIDKSWLRPAKDDNRNNHKGETEVRLAFMRGSPPANGQKDS
jgi:hypothetical protein